MKYRPEVDGIRAVAVVPVILFHAGVPGFAGGYVGVDIFFVISGYLITRLINAEIERGEFSLVRFGGLNRLFKVNTETGSYAELAVFDPIANTSGLGGPPTVEAVPTGLAYSDGKVLVSLLSGGPFIPGLSRVKTVDPVTGDQADFLTGLRTAIDVQPISSHGDTDYLVLENNFAPAPPFPPTGATVRLFEEAGSDSTVVNGCTMYRPTSLSIHPKTGVHYATELLRGTVVRVTMN